MMTNKKKVLFVLHNASLGGSAASMINLLSIYKESGIEHDLFLMDHYGCWTETAAKYARLLPRDKALESAITPRANIRSLMQYLFRVIYILHYKIMGVESAQKSLYRRSARKLRGKYDYNQGYKICWSK